MMILRDSFAEIAQQRWCVMYHKCIMMCMSWLCENKVNAFYSSCFKKEKNFSMLLNWIKSQVLRYAVVSPLCSLWLKSPRCIISQEAPQLRQGSAISFWTRNTQFAFIFPLFLQKHALLIVGGVNFSRFADKQSVASSRPLRKVAKIANNDSIQSYFYHRHHFQNRSLHIAAGWASE